MDLYELLSSIEHKEFHLIRYLKFIDYCNYVNKDVNYEYVERHHIAPKSLFPEYKNTHKYKWNLIKLTARQHYIAHWILAKCYGKGMWLAFKRMNTSNPKNKNFKEYKLPNSILYERCKIESAKYMSEFASNKKASEETKKKMSISHKNRKRSNTKCPHCGKFGAQNLMTRYHFDNCSSLPNNPDIKEVKLSKCPHCSKEGNAIAMGRWHFDNCKYNPDIDKDKLENRIIKGQCVHCNKITDIANLSQHHMDNCKHNPNISEEALEKRKEKLKFLSLIAKGRQKTEEERKKLSEANKGKKKPQKVVKCPHCNKSGGKQNMTRYHFDNCKYKNS